jgi:hypothetical protein
MVASLLRFLDILKAKLQAFNQLSNLLAGIPLIKPIFLIVAPAQIKPNIITKPKAVKCGLIRSNPIPS